MEIILDIAATHPQGADVWVGMWPPPLRQTLKSRYDNSSNYTNALTNLSEKRLVFFRKKYPRHLRRRSRSSGQNVLQQ